MATLYHNPRCSKSRQAKALLDEAGIRYEECLYLKADLNAEHYRDLLIQLGGEPITHLRKSEQPFGLIPADADLDQIAQTLAEHPILLERPVLVTEQGAKVCRPPELVQTLI